MEKTIKFLKALKKNNNKEWFDKHKSQYLEAKAEYEDLVGRLIAIISKFDKKINPGLKVKDCVFRIYKDVRFSKDKTPYKTNMGADISAGGKKASMPGYYFHFEPGNSFLAAGSHMPAPEQLTAIRQEIDYNGDKLEKILKSKSYSKYCKGLDDYDRLVTSPKGYAKDHKHIELLKNKSFLAFHPIPEKYLTSKQLDKYAGEGFKAMLPLVEFLREAIAH